MAGAPPLAVAVVVFAVVFAGAAAFADAGAWPWPPSVGARALDMLAAVGLLSLSSASFDAVFFLAGGGGTSLLRARASDAAVGANSPVDGAPLGLGDVVAEGVLGRDADGVFGLAAGAGAEADGVFGRDGVTDAREAGLDREGVALVEAEPDPAALIAGEMDAVEDERAGWYDDGGDFAGVRVSAAFAFAVLGLFLDGVVGARTLALEGRADVGLEAATAFFGDGGVGEATLSDVTGETEAFSEGFSAGGAGSGGGATGVSGATATVAGFGSSSGSGAGAGGSGDLIKPSSFDSNALATIGALGFGGHSRRSFSSSFAASPVCWDATLDDLGGAADAAFCCFLFCCSNRPMRLATLWRGRSSGSGLPRSEGR